MISISPPLSTDVSSNTDSSQIGYRRKPLEKLYRNCSPLEEIERKLFAEMLWKAFPSAISENQLSEMVAEVLTEEHRPIHPKTVVNWLRLDNAPHFRYVIRIFALVGAEGIFQMIDAEAA